MTILNDFKFVTHNYYFTSTSFIFNWAQDFGLSWIKKVVIVIVYFVASLLELTTAWLLLDPGSVEAWTACFKMGSTVVEDSVLKQFLVIGSSEVTRSIVFTFDV